MILEGPIRHVLINKESLVTVGAVADQVHKVAVVKETQHQNLHQELSIALEPISI